MEIAGYHDMEQLWHDEHTAFVITLQSAYDMRLQNKLNCGRLGPRYDGDNEHCQAEIAQYIE